jgi:hypothetical protein
MRIFKDWDMYEINKWLEKHGQPTCERSDLPKYGFIIDEVAAGFLCQTDGNVCLLDPFITNKDAPSLDRHTGLNQIASAVDTLAKDLGYKRSIIISKEQSLLNRGEVLGYKISTIGFGYKELGG